MASKAWRILSQVLDRVNSSQRQQASFLPLSYYDLVETFAEPGCAVCNLLLRDADRLLDSILYELTLDPDIHQAFRARLGLCNEHSWQALQYRGMSLGIAILYKTALDEALRIIEDTPIDEATDGQKSIRLWGRGSEPSLLAKRLEPAETCIVCQLVARAEERYIQTLGQYVNDARLGEAYRASDGLCLPHFRQALLAAEAPSSRKQLAAIQKAALLRLKADLDGFIDKSNYLRSHEITDREGNSWRRVIRIAGERGVFGPDRRTED